MLAMLAGPVAAVFMYHHVASAPGTGPYGRALTVTPKQFEAQLRDLRARGCSAVTLARLVGDVAAGRGGDCEVALTFDDGYADAESVAAPLLRSYSDAGTFFVSTGYIGAPGHLTRAQVTALSASGMEVDAHTITHADLTLESARAAAAEIDGSRRTLRALTSQPVIGFAYPAGRYDARVEGLVRRAGFAFAVTTLPGRITAARIAADTYALPRYRIERDDGLAVLREALGPAPTARETAATAHAAAALRAVARRRIEGNAPGIAERVAVALLSGGFPEPIQKVRALRAAGATVVGVMLSGVKFHRTLDRDTFGADVADMVDRAFSADASVTEVDVWAVVPIAVPGGAPVSGDLAVPTDRTVFSASVLRDAWVREPDALGETYWERGFLQGGR